MTSALLLQDITVTFGGIRALGNVTVDIGENDVVALVGPNGAGKTTLLNAVSGLLRGNVSGSVELFGERILEKPAHVIAGLGIGRSFQDPPLLEKESVLENILVGAHLSLGYQGIDQLFRRGRMRRSEAEATKRAKDAGSNMTIPQLEAATAAKLPLRRLGVVADCANLALFLASDESSWITGTAMPLDGGLAAT